MLPTLSCKSKLPALQGCLTNVFWNEFHAFPSSNSYSFVSGRQKVKKTSQSTLCH